MPDTSSKTLDHYGWHAVPRAPISLLSSVSHINPPALSHSSLPFPSTPLTRATLSHVTSLLPRQTLNHCLRVYYFGAAILQTHFPHWLSDGWVDHETWLLACLWHDIGTTHDHLRSTHMSFDFWGATEAMHQLSSADFLKSQSESDGKPAPKSQAESICECILRHQDPGETGMLTCLTALIQLGTLLDNAGKFGELVHRGTIEAVVAKYPREGWSGCFAGTVREEIGLKPWANSTRIEGFAEAVEGNELMKKWD